MLENIQEAITGLLGAIGDLLSPTAASDGFGPTAAGVAAIALLFAIPVTAAVARKVTSLVKGIKG